MATSGNDVLLVQNTSPAILGGLAGDDTYIISGSLLTDTPKEITISDTEGSNSIQLVGGLEIASSIVAAESLQFTLSNGVIINVNGANTFGYEPGGNATAGIDEPDVSYEDFVGDTLGSSVPTGSDTASGGEVTIGGGDPTPSGGFTIAADDAVQDEGDTGTTQDFTFTVSREDTSGSAQVDFAVDFPNSDADADDFDVEAGTVSFADGEETATATVRVSGDGDVEPDENFTVALTNPIGDVLGDTTSAVGTIENDDVASLSVAPAEVTEGDSGLNSVMVEVSLDQPALTDVTFDLSASAEPTDTANPGTPNQDFIPDTVSGTIPAGDTSTMVEFEIITDTVAEENETFTATLSNPSGANIDPAAGSAQVTILDDDGITISIEDAQIVEQDAITQTLSFTVSLSEAPGTGNTVQVDYATADATATTADGDYNQNNGSLAFTGSTTTQTFNVQVNGDTRIELGGADGITDINTGNLDIGEFFNVNLSNATLNGAPAGVTIADDQAVGNIVDDDLPVFTINDVEFIREQDSGTNPTATVTIDLAQPATDSLSVDLLAFDGTATLADSDYLASGQTTVTFDPGQTTRTFDVTVIGDPNTDEVNEEINVALFNARGELNEIVFDDPAVYSDPQLLEVGTRPGGQGTFDDTTDGAGAAVGTDFLDQNGPVDVEGLSNVADGDTIIGSSASVTILEDDTADANGDYVQGALVVDDDLVPDHVLGALGFTGPVANTNGNGIQPDNGTDGGDVLQGLSGDDYMNGGVGDDKLFGGLGNDVVVGDSGTQGSLLTPAFGPANGNDSLFGDEGNDILFGDSNLGSGPFTPGDVAGGSDLLEGGAGDDFLSGGDGQDILRGGSGDDDFTYMRQNEIDDNDFIEDFGDGNDRIVFDVGTSAFGTMNFTNTATVPTNIGLSRRSTTMVTTGGSTATLTVGLQLGFPFSTLFTPGGMTATVPTIGGGATSLLNGVFANAALGGTLRVLSAQSMGVASGARDFFSTASLSAVGGFLFSDLNNASQFAQRLNAINAGTSSFNTGGTFSAAGFSRILAFGINTAGTVLYGATFNLTGTATNADVGGANAFTILTSGGSSIDAGDIFLV